MFFRHFSHKIPSGLRKNIRLLFYKHRFPSGIGDKLKCDIKPIIPKINAFNNYF
jgi:hypothetical protein